MSRPRLVAGCLLILVAFPVAHANGAAATAKPPRPATRPGGSPFKDELLTAENYAKIENGMTKDQVKEILGPYRGASSSSGTHDSTLIWRPSGDSKHHIDVHFKEGVVVGKSTTIDFAAQAAVAAKQAAAAAAAALGGNFAKLKPGMTEAEVQAIMGAPTKTDRASAGRSGYTWRPDADKFAFVIFQDGKATEMDCSEATPRNHDITPANYHRIHAGMDVAAVQTLLGAAAEEQPQGKGTRYTWRKDKTTLSVVANDGKVSAKTSSLKDAPLVSFEKTADDQINNAVANLSSNDARKVKSALSFLAHATFDEARAPEVSKLIERHLNDKDSFVASDADRAIRKWATKENVPHFLRVLSKPVGRDVFDKNRDDMPLAIEILARFKEPAAVPHLVRLLKDFFSKGDVAFALKRMGPELCEAELRKYANDPSPAMRDRVADILAEFKDGGTNLTRNLRDLTNPSKELRSLACQGLAKMYVHPRRKQEVARVVEPLLNDPDEYVIIAAAQALARWGSSQNEPALLVALGKTNGDIRRAVVEALGQIGTPRCGPALEPLVADKDARTGEAARDALAAIRRR